jgi:hypothetical protein
MKFKWHGEGLKFHSKFILYNTYEALFLRFTVLTITDSFAKEGLKEY